MQSVLKFNTVKEYEMTALKKIITALAFSSLCVTYTSHATPIVEDWNFIVDTAFTEFNHATEVAGTNTNTYFSAPTTLSWGIPLGSNQSSLDVSSGSNGNVIGTVETDGASVQTASLIHNNFVIDFPLTNGDPDPTKALTDATLKTKLQLDPLGANSDPFLINPPELVFDITFKETPNDGPCADVTSPIPCNDIFVIDLLGSGGVFDPISSSFNQMFTLGDHNYNVRLAVVGLGILANPVCAAAGADDGCIGLTTIENRINSFAVNMSISLVPEPSVILLMSLALLGIAVSTRNKSNFMES